MGAPEGITRPVPTPNANREGVLWPHDWRTDMGILGVREICPILLGQRPGEVLGVLARDIRRSSDPAMNTGVGIMNTLGDRLPAPLEEIAHTQRYGNR